MLNNMRIKTSYDVEQWFAKVKEVVGDRKYTDMKKLYKESQVRDFGFKIWNIPNDYDSRFFDYTIELPWESPSMF